MSDLWARLRDPSLSTVLVLALVAITGAALLVLGYRGVALRLLVPYQVPFLLSASVVGATLIGMACILLAIHLDRLEAALEHEALNELQRDALQLLIVAAPRAGLTVGVVHDPYFARLRAGQSNPAVLAALREEPEVVRRMTALQQGAANGNYATPDVGVLTAEAPGPHGPVEVRVYRPRGAANELRFLFVWVHGGGWVEGDLDMGEADYTSREVCERAGAVVVSVGYRLAGEGVHYPVPLDDVVAAWRWALESAPDWRADPDRAVLGGASAGGNLAAGAVLRLADEDGPVPAALALVYPALHRELPPLDDAQRERVALSPAALGHFGEGLRLMLENYLGAPVAQAPDYVVPADGDLSKLPPTLVMTCEWDLLRSSGEAFAGQLTRAAVPHRLVIVPEADHGHLNHGWMPQARQSYQDLADWLTEGPALQGASDDVRPSVRT